jgi:UDP-glucose-4-epimerase GalE
MRILVLGGAGYIGSHCCKLLSERGFEPIVYDNLSSGHASFVRWGQLIVGDIRDRDRLTAAILEARPSAVMHLAALSLVGPSVTNPGPYFEVNVSGTLNLLECMRNTGQQHLIFSSSCAIYGEAALSPIDEQVPCKPANAYGSSKLTCELMMDAFDRAHDIRSVRLRYFNAAGADPDGDIGEWHEPETHLIPLVIDAALGRRPPIKIFGTDYRTRDGTAVRDYIHVRDLASAHLAALNHLLDGGQGMAVNVGTGEGFSVSEVIDRVSLVSGRAVPSEISQRRPGDPATLVCDPRKAWAQLGWRAEYGLPTIIRDAWEWHRRRK